MRHLATAFLFSLLFGATCHNPNNLGGTCQDSITVCIDDRPYVCGGNYWRPVGDTRCGPAGAVCCLTRSGVHSCVHQSACVGGGQ